MFRDLLVSLPLPLLLPALLQAAAPPAQSSQTEKLTVKAVKDIAYYEGDDAHPVKHKLDLYLPEGKKDFPMLFFVHGGAWVHGDKNFLGVYSGVARAFAREGIGVAVTNYRLSPAVKHPEHIKDVARAFAWVCKNIARHGGNPEQIFVCGHSAGGHLVALLSTDERYLKEHGLSAKSIKGAIPISGVYVIPNLFLPPVFGTDGEVKKLASPINHVRAGLPPFLILYADRDLPVCARKPSEAFCQAIKDKGSKAETLELKNSDHLWIILAAGMADSAAHQGIVAFIRSQIVR